MALKWVARDAAINYRVWYLVDLFTSKNTVDDATVGSIQQRASKNTLLSFVYFVLFSFFFSPRIFCFLEDTFSDCRAFLFHFIFDDFKLYFFQSRVGYFQVPR